MKVYVKKYVIATKEYPIMFDDGSGNQAEDFEDAELYGSEYDAKEQLDRFDDDCINKWCVVPVDVTYNF